MIMGTNIKGLAAVLVCALGMHGVVRSQAVYRIVATKGIDMRLSGTSTLHDWEMGASDVTGEAGFIFRSGSKTDLVSLPSLSFTLRVKDLKSDNKGLDKNAYAALKSEEHKNIVYRLTSSILSAETGGYLLKTKGKLTVAGVTRDIDMNVHCVVNASGTITCTGNTELNMTDFKVEPPSFMFGAMSTGDAIKLDFSVVYKMV